MDELQGPGLQELTLADPARRLPRQQDCAGIQPCGDCMLHVGSHLSCLRRGCSAEKSTVVEPESQSVNRTPVNLDVVRSSFSTEIVSGMTPAELSGVEPAVTLSNQSPLWSSPPERRRLLSHSLLKMATSEFHHASPPDQAPTFTRRSSASTQPSYPPSDT